MCTLVSSLQLFWRVYATSAAAMFAPFAGRVFAPVTV